MASPKPPVALEGQCSIIYDNTLYVYSPEAFLSLPLKENATWTKEVNGVSVTGALCVKGGVDGDSANPALYVVGGATNGSVQDYSGIQRYSIRNKVWETISPISAVTANRQNHGATYLNASSAILVYGGSQNGDEGYSTETFLMLMYPPYRVQAYSSIAPAVKQPFLLPWTADQAVMVGGGYGNQQVFTFHPDPGWVNLGVTLPVVLPDPSIAQVNLQRLEDGSRVLQTYYTNESPNRLTRHVLTNPGFVPASYGQTIGDPVSNSRLFRRQSTLADYPAYNGTNVPQESRTGASLAANSELVAIVGGDSNSTVSVFNSTGNSWVDSKALFGAQQPLTTSSTTSATSTPTASQTRAATSSATSAAAASGGGQTNGLAILGGVLGGICGFAAILIIALLWLRSKRRKKAADAAAKNKSNDSAYPDDKARHLAADDDATLKPLSQQAQPMGRSPVPSAIMDRDSMAIVGGKVNEKSLEAGQYPQGSSRLNPNHAANNSVGGFFKSNNKTPMSISKPMMADLGDYQGKSSIDLGAATPSTAPVLPPIGAATAQQKADQRKTDEGWAKYFQADKEEKKKSAPTEYPAALENDPRRSGSRPSTAKSSGGFWPGAGVPTTNRPSKLPLRDSAGNLLTGGTVSTASPSFQGGHADSHNRSLPIAAPAQAKISSADSISTDHSSDDGYEDDDMDAYSDGRDSYQHNAWNPIGNTWSGPSQRPLRPPSVRVGASAFPPPPPTTSHSEETTATTASGGSSIPAFPMPAAAIGRADTTDQYTGTSTAQRPPQPPPASYKPQNPYAHARQSSNTMTFGAGPAHTRQASKTLAYEQVTLPHKRAPSDAMAYNGGPAIPDYFGPPGTASSRADSGKLPDSTDMSWLNLGTPAHVHGSQHSADSRDPA